MHSNKSFVTKIENQIARFEKGTVVYQLARMTHVCSEIKNDACHSYTKREQKHEA